MRTRILLAVGLAALLVAAVAHADGQHHARFDLKNDTKYTMEVKVYNGDDGLCLLPHKETDVPPGSTLDVKCHGQGKHQCRVEVEAGGSDFGCFSNKDGQSVRCWVYEGKITCGN